MYTDSDGDFPILILVIVALYTAWAVHDVIEIVTEEVKFVEDADGNGGQIENSYKVQNPSVVLAYSIYLKYFSEHKDCFDGSASGIAAEWMAHNVGYDLTVVTSLVGIGEDWNKRAKHADIGRTIFNEKEWYVKYPSIAIETIFNPVSVIYDYFQYIYQSEGDGND